VHPSLVKRGFYKRNATAPYAESPMTYEQLVKLAASWNKEGKRDTSVKDVTVLDVLDQTAVAKVTASWGGGLRPAREVRRQLEHHADSLAEPAAEAVTAPRQRP